MQNRIVTLKSRPVGEPKPEHFEMRTEEAKSAGDGQLLIRNLWLSLDPYMRGRMSDAKSYAKPVEIGEVMTGGTVGEVIESRHPKFAKGDIVSVIGGWQDYVVSDGIGVFKLDPSRAPAQNYLGVLGMPGLTGYTGLLNIGEPKPGETVVVAAAAGPVGSIVGQIARIKGCRTVGIAGGPDKVKYLTEELGFDAAVDHRSPNFKAELKQACPGGIDVYFENVGGAVFDAVLPLLNDFARVPLCGLVANYNMTELPAGPDRTALLLRNILTKRLRVQGFIVTDYAAQTPTFLKEVGGWLKEGRIKHREDVVEGLENAPEAFIGMLKGRNFGKLLVKIA